VPQKLFCWRGDPLKRPTLECKRFCFQIVIFLQ